jgi:hypothetical protein
MPLPHVLKRIRLELARSKEFPLDSANHGYEFVAPLDSKGHIDPHLWQKHREHCGVRRFWSGADEEIGRLLTSRAGRSTRDGCSTTTRTQPTTTRRDIASGRTPLRPASMFQSAVKRVSRIPSR